MRTTFEDASSNSDRERNNNNNNNNTNNNNNNNNSKDREPILSKYAPKYDLKLFQEAQAVVSELIVSFSFNLFDKCFIIYSFPIIYWLQ